MILVLSDLWQPFPGGAERLMFNLARDLMRRGEEVRVLTGYEAARQLDGPKVDIDLAITGDSLTGYIAALAPQVILTHHIYARQFESELRASGVPVVQVVLNGERMRWVAMAVHISTFVLRKAKPRAGDLRITPPVFDDVVADEHGDAIGFIKPIPHKGVELFYAIAAALPDREFVVLRGEWQTLEDIRPLPNVTFIEPVVDMRDFYARCRLLLVPSESEDAGTVAQEATANGLACISSDVGGLSETNRGGILLPSKALGRWVQAIRSLDNPQRYRLVVERQRRHLASTQQSKRLDEFAARIRELASNPS